ncbi:hypothetical protein Slin14017_G026150 [Septoria linicola]|nr:hypothetical protein Slin14017_G026150 [Septoria linicola]
MAPAEESQIAPRPRYQTVVEADFLRRTGLDPNDDEDMQLYSLMKREVLAGVRRLSDAGYNDNESESALQVEIVRIYQDASTATRSVYDRGVVGEGDQAHENWVIRWLLWNAMNQPNGR